MPTDPLPLAPLDFPFSFLGGERFFWGTRPGTMAGYQPLARSIQYLLGKTSLWNHRLPLINSLRVSEASLMRQEKASPPFYQALDSLLFAYDLPFPQRCPVLLQDWTSYRRPGNLSSLPYSFGITHFPYDRRSARCSVAQFSRHAGITGSQSRNVPGEIRSMPRWAREKKSFRSRRSRNVSSSPS